MRLTFVIDADLDHRDLNVYAERTHTSLAAVIHEVTVQCEQRLIAALKADAVEQVTVRTLIDVDAATMTRRLAEAAG
jgi:hypothetical protein